MPGPTAVLDACTLYSNLRRDILMWVAVYELYHPKWADEIHDEWTTNLLANSPRLDPAKVARTRRLMDSEVDEALIPASEYRGYLPQSRLPDPKDGHVLALAIATQAEVIVTLNLKDFPRSALPPDMEACHPDQFLARLLDGNPIAFCQAVKECRQNMRNPRRSVKDLLAAIAGKLGEMPELSKALLPYAASL